MTNFTSGPPPRRKKTTKVLSLALQEDVRNTARKDQWAFELGYSSANLASAERTRMLAWAATQDDLVLPPNAVKTRCVGEGSHAVYFKAVSVGTSYTP